jgi:hypothetical protein
LRLVTLARANSALALLVLAAGALLATRRPVDARGRLEWTEGAMAYRVEPAPMRRMARISTDHGFACLKGPRDTGTEPIAPEDVERLFTTMPGQPVVRGAIDEKSVLRVIRNHASEAKGCYEKARQAGGRVVIQLAIASSGVVVTSVVQQSTLNDPSVEECIAQAARRWLFPEPPERDDLTLVWYPFQVGGVE